MQRSFLGHAGCIGGCYQWQRRVGVVRLLDYYKFFDSFEPNFFAQLLRDSGMDPKSIDLFLDLTTQAERRIKIGQTYGESFGTFNALGQGDPFTLIVALVYVSVQFRVLEDRFPGISMDAVVDDRNLRGRRETVRDAVVEVGIFDKMAGHRTNAAKMAILATTKLAQQWFMEKVFEGVRAKVATRTTLVGDTVTTSCSGNSSKT